MATKNKNEQRCEYCGKTLSHNNVICFMQFGEPCEEQLQKHYEEDMQERFLDMQWRIHEETQRQNGEID